MGTPAPELSRMVYKPPVGVSPRLGKVIVQGHVLAAALRKIIEERTRESRGANA